MSDITQNSGAKPEPQIANGWTAREAQAMDAHISRKVAQEWSRSEPSNAEYRRAERISDATDPMHDAQREAQANAHRGPAAVREMTPQEQARDYERVNGASDRARAEEIRLYGPGGYKGDPGTDAAERRAEIQGDATMQSLPGIARRERLQDDSSTSASRRQFSEQYRDSLVAAGRTQERASAVRAPSQDSGPDDVARRGRGRS